MVEEGDAIWFPADKVCHRGVPSNFQGSSSASAQQRRLLFWFSWEKDSLPSTLEPDINFQLNPWTVHSLVCNDFERNLVSLSSYCLLPSFFPPFANFSTAFSSFFHAVDGVSTLCSLWDTHRGIFSSSCSS